MSLTTPVTRLLGCEHPILLAGMGNTSKAPLVAAVSNAGESLFSRTGRGIHLADGSHRWIWSNWRSQIYTIHASGVTRWGEGNLRKGLGLIYFTQNNPCLCRNTSKIRLCLSVLIFYCPRLEDRPAKQMWVPCLDEIVAGTGLCLLIPNQRDYTKGQLDELIDIIIESGAKLFVAAVGLPPRDVVNKLHAAGVLYMVRMVLSCQFTWSPTDRSTSLKNMVGHPKVIISRRQLILNILTNFQHAVRACENGADIICAQGGEAGGHTGDISTRFWSQWLLCILVYYWHPLIVSLFLPVPTSVKGTNRVLRASQFSWSQQVAWPMVVVSLPLYPSARVLYGLALGLLLARSQVPPKLQRISQFHYYCYLHRVILWPPQDHKSNLRFDN